MSAADPSGTVVETGPPQGQVVITARQPPPQIGAEVQVAPPAPRSAPRVIALMNQKGGVGKTTTCVNLGAALARQGQRVLLIDLDPQAHLTLHLGLHPAHIAKSMYDLMVDRAVSGDEVLQATSAGIDVLPAEVNLAGVEAELADRVVTGAAQTVLKQKVAPLLSGEMPASRQGDSAIRNPGTETRTYDSVLIDCPPSLGLLTINALTLAREVIVPMQAHFLALQGLGKLFETITMLREGVNPELVVAGVVLCMHEKQTILAGEVIADLQKFLAAARGTDEPWRDAVVYEPPVRRNIKLAESPSFGQTIFQYAPDCHGAEDYLRLAESVAAHRVT